MKHKMGYNDCYGGYTLADKAIDWLSERWRNRWIYYLIVEWGACH